MRREWCWLALGLLSAHAHAEPPSALPAAPAALVRAPDAGEAELSARLRVLLAETTDAEVKRPAEQAKLALERARDPAKDEASRARSLELARAALTLAEARQQLAAERSLNTRAQSRRDAATARLLRARAGGTQP
jgi:hypothetical protein